MANLGAPPVREFKAIPSDIYEVVTAPYHEDPDSPAEEVANTFFDPDVDSPNKATQFQWTLLMRSDDEFHGIPLRMWTGPSIGRHSRNKLTNLVRITDPKFDIDVAYKNKEEFLTRNALRPLRVTVESVSKGEGDKAKTYAKVTGFLPSKLGELSDVEKLLLTSKQVSSDPFDS
jgi:hypothetical protein